MPAWMCQKWFQYAIARLDLRVINDVTLTECHYHPVQRLYPFQSQIRLLRSIGFFRPALLSACVILHKSTHPLSHFHSAHARYGDLSPAC